MMKSVTSKVKMNKYKVYYKNEYLPDEQWEYIVTASGFLEAKWNGIIEAEREGKNTGWLNVFCEEIKGE